MAVVALIYLIVAVCAYFAIFGNRSSTIYPPGWPLAVLALLLRVAISLLWLPLALVLAWDSCRPREFEVEDSSP